MTDPLPLSGPVWAAVDLEALKGNVRALCAMLSPGTELMAVVKANAYGHGAVQISQAALSAGASRLGIAFPSEGEQLRRAGIVVPILVLGTYPAGQAEAVCRWQLDQTVFLPEHVLELSRAAQEAGTTVHTHIKADTGMGRIGIRSLTELDTLLDAFDACPNIEASGMFTHFAYADGESQDYTRMQAESFMCLYNRVRERGFSPMLHAANSAAIIRYPELNFNCVRAGIVMYGYGADDRPQEGLNPVMSWMARIVYIKTIAAGCKVSYGCTFEAKRDTVVATLPVGYADGYHRVFSNRGWVLIRGKKAPIIGRVCMDQTMVDITDIPGATVGDEAVLMGRQGDEALDAGMLGGWADTISYEILCGVGNRVERRYVP